MTEAVVEQEAFGQGGFFTSLGRPGRTGDQKTSRRFYHWNDLRSRRQHGIAKAPGDCDGNGRFGGTPTEAVAGLDFTFRGGTEPPCLAACDAEANGTLNITDYVRILRSAFLGQGEPDAPFPNCEKSSTPGDIALGCATPTVCP